jgi:hypothetical protein
MTLQRLGRPAGSACSADAAQRGRLVAEEICLGRTDDAPRVADG